MDVDGLAQWVSRLQSRRSAARLLGGGAFAASVTGLSLLADNEAAVGKKRKKKVCLCTPRGCTSKKVKNRTKVIQQNPQCNYAGACGANPCAGTPCATSAECSGGQVCVSGLCADCTSYTQCGTTATVGNLACIGGRCKGNEVCTATSECTAPLECLEPPAPGDDPDRCILFSDCQDDSTCGNPNFPVCVLGDCLATCTSNADCSGSRTCQGGVCLPAS
jgi:hypothetical protein